MSHDLFKGDPASPADRADWPINDLGAAKRLLAMKPGALKHIHRIGWAAWDGARFDSGHGDALALRLAQELQQAVLEEARALGRRKASPEALAMAEAEAAAERAMVEQLGGDVSKVASADDRVKKQLKGRAAKLRDWALKLGNAASLRNALSLAAVQAECMVDPIEMDGRARVLNCANGRLDLSALPSADEDGVLPDELAAALGEHDPADLATRVTRAPFVPGAEAPFWQETLALFVPDAAERAYLQRCVGYALQGGQDEQVVFLWQGRGANGKSTVLDALAWALGDYMAGAPVEAFLKDEGRGGSSHTTELIRLIGARAVRVSEPEPGMALSDSRIKTWTGGEAVPVREMREKGFEARFDGTLFFSTNGTPRIDSTDDGFWRRFHVMPWRVQLLAGDRRRRPKAVIDAALRAEAEGILAWAVEGWRQYALIGLAPPPAVVAEGEAMRAAIDSLGACLRECFDVGAFEETWKRLYAVVKGWHEAGGLRAPSAKALALRLNERGFPAVERGREKAKVRIGLRIKQGEDRPSDIGRWLAAVPE